MTLYELAHNYQVLLEMMDADPESIKDTLDAIQESLEDKAENIAKLIKNIEGDIATIREEERRLSERRKAYENKVIRLKSYLEEQLIKANIKKVERPTITIAVQNNPHTLEIEDEEKIPIEFTVPQPSKVDRKSLIEWLKAGNTLNGVKLVQKEGLRIR